MTLLFIAGCSQSETQSFKGKKYQLLQAQNDVVVTLAFDAEKPSFYGKIVNNYFGSYSLKGSSLSLNLAGSTMMMGPTEEMEAEQNFLQILPRIKAYKFSGTTLVLITDNGQELGFKEIGLSDFDNAE